METSVNLLSAGCRSLQRVRERIAARSAAPEAHLEASLHALAARVAALQARFDASLLAFAARLAPLPARLAAHRARVARLALRGASGTHRPPVT
eukprot:4042768-Pyramimonas_sp.AAC.1